MRELILCKGAKIVARRFMMTRERSDGEDNKTIFAAFQEEARREQGLLKRRMPRGRAAASMIMEALGYKTEEQSRTQPDTRRRSR